MTIDLCGMELEHPVMNAAGVVKTIRELEVAVISPLSAIVIGSLTGSQEERVGNPEPCLIYDRARGYVVNAMGLPEPGLDYYDKSYNASRWLKLLDMARADGKKIILSIAPLGDFLENLEILIGLAKKWEVDAIELNLGCPNVWSASWQKPIASYDRDGIFQQVRSVLRCWDGPVGLKMSPYSNPLELRRAALLIAQLTCNPADRHRVYIVTSNTFPNAVVVKDGKPSLSVEYGGFSGPAYLPIALGQVLQWVRALKEYESKAPVVGVGGITTGQDVRDFLNLGAVAVQVGWKYFDRGPASVEQILANCWI
jgi:dihydroorotate dehydrogenase (fumarate)